METLRSQVLAYALDNYGTQPDTPWAKYPENQVLRHRGSRKWYALIMRVNRKVLGQTKEGMADVINLKCTGITREILIKESLGQPAYHMNKEKWVTVLLDGSVPLERVCGVLDESYESTK